VNYKADKNHSFKMHSTKSISNLLIFQEYQSINEKILNINQKIIKLKEVNACKLKPLQIKLIKSQESIKKNNEKLKYLEIKQKEILMRRNSQTLPIEKLLKESREIIKSLKKEIDLKETALKNNKKRREEKFRIIVNPLTEVLREIESEKKEIITSKLCLQLPKIIEENQMNQEDLNCKLIEKATLVSELEHLNNQLEAVFIDENFHAYYDYQQNNPHNNEELSKIHTRLVKSYTQSLLIYLLLNIEKAPILFSEYEFLIQGLKREDFRTILSKLDSILKKLNPKCKNIDESLQSFINNKMAEWNAQYIEITKITEIYNRIDGKLNHYSKFIEDIIITGIDETNKLYSNILKRISEQKARLEYLYQKEIETNERLNSCIKNHEERSFLSKKVS